MYPLTFMMLFLVIHKGTCNSMNSGVFIETESNDVNTDLIIGEEIVATTTSCYLNCLHKKGCHNIGFEPDSSIDGTKNRCFYLKKIEENYPNGKLKGLITIDVDKPVLPKPPDYCPLSHPYAFSCGKYCCQTNKEGISDPANKNCNGSDIQSSSTCCYGDKFEKCPYKKCESSPNGLCPKSHPYAYQYGRYCCEINQERKSTPKIESCDGSAIQFQSTCCYGNRYAKCPHYRCRTSPVGYCPKSHPYPYDNGKYCCKNNESCNGSKIGYSSTCCKLNEKRRCLYNRCRKKPAATRGPSKNI